MNVDRVLRESTRARTFTLPNSVTEAFGIFSVSSRSRSTVGFHSTVAAFTCCPTVAPPPGRRPRAPVRGPAGRRARSRAPYAARFGECTRQGANECRPGARYAGAARAAAVAAEEICARGARTLAVPGVVSGCGKLSPSHPENERKRRPKRPPPAHSATFGLDLWFKPLALIHRWSRARPLGANLLHVTKCVAQRAEPGVLVLPDQADAPGKRVTAAAGHAGVDERVQHPPLRLAQPGHHRDRQCGEHHFPALAHHTPGHLAAEPQFRFAGDADPGVTGLLAEPPAPPRRDRIRLSLAVPAAFGRGLLVSCLHRRKLPDDGDLLTVHNHLRLPGEPPVRQPPEEPPAYLPGRVRRRTLSFCTHVIMIT